MDKNYIVLDGNKIKLSEEQIKQISEIIEVSKKNPFKNYQDNFMYPYVIDTVGRVRQSVLDIKYLERECNAFYDSNFAKQVALHQLLYRKLLKYAYENDAVVDDWTDLNSKKYFIIKRTNENELVTIWSVTLKNDCVVYFTSDEVAKLAIENVVKPFMEEHPEFVW